MKFPASVFGLLLLSVLSLPAAVLVKYDFESSNLLPSVTTPGVMTGGAITGNFANTTGTINTTNSIRRFLFSKITTTTAWGNVTPLIRVQSTSNSSSAAVANNAYLAMTLQPGEVVSLAAISLDIGSTRADYPFGMTIRSSITGTTDLFSADATGQFGRRVTADLTAHSEFASMEDPVTFYFYLYEYSGTNTQNFYMDNISFESVPEPGSVLLCGSGVAGLLLNRRRRSF